VLLEEELQKLWKNFNGFEQLTLKKIVAKKYYTIKIYFKKS